MRTVARYGETGQSDRARYLLDHRLADGCRDIGLVTASPGATV